MDFCRNSTIHAAQTYDIIFIPPYGQIPLEDDGVRKILPAHQLMIHMLVEQAVVSGIGPYHAHPIQTLSLEDRVTEVMDVISKVQDVKVATQLEKKESKGEQLLLPGVEEKLLLN